MHAQSIITGMNLSPHGQYWKPLMLVTVDITARITVLSVFIITETTDLCYFVDNGLIMLKISAFEASRVKV
jgi:hypothetical protein